LGQYSIVTDGFMFYKLSVVKLELIDRTKCDSQNKVFFL